MQGVAAISLIVSVILIYLFIRICFAIINLEKQMRLLNHILENLGKRTVEYYTYNINKEKNYAKEKEERR